jgi:hypothetical protein
MKTLQQNSAEHFFDERCCSQNQVCQIFLVQHTKTGEMYQMTTKYAKLLQNIPN